jgi:FkbH-like protein
LEKLLCDPDHLLLAASLRDCFGDYGTIGLAVLQTTQDVWVLRLLLTSCRVVSRGAGSLLLDDIRRRAYEAGVGLEAEMIPTERNRIMGVTLRLAGFELLPARRGDRIVLSATAAAPPIPQHVTVRSEP